MRLRLFTLLLLIIALVPSQYIHSQEVTIKRSSVVEQYKGKPYYIHFVAQGETLTSLAKAYNVSIEELNAENPAIDKGLKADMVLRIPQKPAMEIPSANAPQVEKPKATAVASEKPAEKALVEKKTEPAKAVPVPNTQVQPSEKPKLQSKPSDDQNYTLYQVKKQETLYGISKQYNVSVDDIMNANPGFTGLDEGMEIRIPKHKSTDKTVSVDVPAPKGNKAEPVPDEITVKQGETLYSIAKARNTTVDELVDLNPQLSEGLKAGMVLKLRKPEGKPESKPTGQSTPAALRPAKHNECYNPDNINKTYKIGLLLPFLLDEATAALEAPEQKDPSVFENFNYFQFYAGFMLAADSLEKYGLHARIQVLDADRLNDSLAIRQTLRKPGLDKMDLLIGPMYASSFTIADRFAEKHSIGIINPLSRRESIVHGNPYVIKTQASGTGISAKLASFISHNYPGANIVSVRNDKKELKVVADDFSARIKANITAHSFSGSFQESVFSTDLMGGVAKKLKAGVQNIVIFFSNNKNAVPNFISLLNPNAKSDNIILIGMDGWEELDLETEFLVNLNYHQLTSNYIDYESEAVQQFTARFRAKYGAVPLSTRHAFLGYDIGWYFLTSLMWYGDHYMECIPEYKGNGLQFDFDFSGAEKGDGLQNQAINIVKLQDYKMVKVE